MFFGWWVVGSTFLLAVWSSGFGLFGLSVYLVELQRQHHWTTSTISFAVTGYYLIGALLMTRLGDAIRRYGARRTVVIGIATMAGGVFALTCVAEVWQMYLAFAVMALGWATTSSAAVNILLAPWFEKRRGLAVSLALMGASVSGFVVAPALLTLVGSLGFRQGVGVTLLAMLSLLLPPVMLTIGRTPASLGLGADGRAASSRGMEPSIAARRIAPTAVPAPSLGSQGRAEAIRTLRYWTISLAFAAAFTAQIGTWTHLVAYLLPFRGAGGAALALSTTTLAALTGRVALGVLADRRQLRLLSCAVFLAQAGGLALLTFAGSGYALYTGCLLFGFGAGNVTTLPGLLVHREFRPEQFAGVVSLISATNQLGFAFGPTLLGVVRDVTGSYGTALWLAAGLDALAATLILLGGRLNGSES